MRLVQVFSVRTCRRYENIPLPSRPFLIGSRPARPRAGKPASTAASGIATLANVRPTRGCGVTARETATPLLMSPNCHGVAGRIEGDLGTSLALYRHRRQVSTDFADLDRRATVRSHAGLPTSSQPCGRPDFMAGLAHLDQSGRAEAAANEGPELATPELQAQSNHRNVVGTALKRWPPRNLESQEGGTTGH